jgi:hypothetical protein
MKRHAEIPWDATATTATTATATPELSVKRNLPQLTIMKSMVEALRKAPNRELHGDTLADVLISTGVTQSKPAIIKMYLSQLAKKHPDQVQKVDGVFKLLSPSSPRHDSVESGQSEHETETLDPQSLIGELMMLRHLRERNSNAIMGLARVIVELVTP